MSGTFGDTTKWNDGSGVPGAADQAQLFDGGFGPYTVTVPVAGGTVDDVILTYAGATLAVAGGLTLGAAGVGLALQQGTVTVTAGGSVQGTGQIQIGDSANVAVGGTLDVAAGATATVRSSFVSGTSSIDIAGGLKDTGDGTLLDDSLAMSGTSRMTLSGQQLDVNGFVVPTLLDAGSAGLATAAGDSVRVDLLGRAEWQVVGLLAIGVAGDAIVTVPTGSRIEFGTASFNPNLPLVGAELGVAAGSHGTLVLAGGNLDSSSGGVVVGVSSAGTLQLTKQSFLYVGKDKTNFFTDRPALIVGLSVGSVGLVTMDHSGGTLSGFGVVGSSGEGTLAIAAGKLTVGEAFAIGDRTTGRGLVTVDNLGTLTGTEGLTVGSLGTGTLDVIGGGQVILPVASTPNGTIEPVLVVGAGAGSHGVLTIAGPGSGVTPYHEMVVGLSGTGSLDVNFARLDGRLTTITLGGSAGSVGIATVHDGSQVLAENLTVGAGGSGSLDVRSHGDVATSGRTVIGASGTIGIADQGAFHTGSFVDRGDIAVTGSGGSFQAFSDSFLDGGRLSVDATGRATVGLSDGGAGALTISEGHALEGFGTIDAALAVDGRVIAASALPGSIDGGLGSGVAGELVLTGSIGGAGALEAAAGAALDLQGAVGSGVTVILGSLSGGPHATVRIERPDLFEGTIQDFHYGDVIDLGAVGARTASYDSHQQLLRAFDSSNQQVAALAMTGVGDVAAAASFSVSSGGGVSLACFATGTRIATAEGDVAVEALRVGDRVRIAGGALRPVRWIGRRHLPHPAPDLWPVRIAAGAFAPGVPARELRLSPDHAVLCGSALVPVKALVNGATVAPVRVASVTYWHVELDSHDVLLAEGLAVESYLESGFRSSFEGGAAVALHPRFGSFAPGSCRPIRTEGDEVAAAKATLLARAEALGHAWTNDPALRVDGGSGERDGTVWRFILPEPAGFRLLSRAVVAAHVTEGSDPRRLGVAVTGLLVDGASVALDDPRLGEGWHAPESGWRWTDGDAQVAIAGALHVDVALANATLRYPEGNGVWGRRPQRVQGGALA